MKVRLVVTVDLDPHLWVMEYPGESARPSWDEVRADVTKYLRNQIEHAVGVQVAGAAVTVRDAGSTVTVR